MAAEAKKPSRDAYAAGSGVEEKFNPLSHSFEHFKESAETKANVLSRLTFWYVGEVLKVGAATSRSKGGLDHSDLWRMAEQDESEAVLKDFALHWAAEEEKVKGSDQYREAVAAGAPLPKVHFANVLLRAFKRPMVVAGIFKFFNDVSQFAWPYLLLRFLEFLEDLKDRRDRDKVHGRNAIPDRRERPHAHAGAELGRSDRAYAVEHVGVFAVGYVWRRRTLPSRSVSIS